MGTADLCKIENFDYDGLFVTPKKGYAKYTVSKFVRWTNDPGVGLFLCSDNKERLIPTCQLTTAYCKTLPPQPESTVIFGTPSKS